MLDIKGHSAFLENETNQQPPPIHPLHRRNSPSLRRTPMPWTSTACQATKLAAEADQKKPDLTPEQLIPLEYHKYLDIFDKDKANRFSDT
jgi:hypothetical protein